MCTLCTEAAEFPDLSQRERLNTKMSSKIVQQGARAMTVYLCQREDCDTFRLADDIDPNYAEAVGIAKNMVLRRFAMIVF